MKNNIIFILVIISAFFIYQNFFSSNDKKEINKIINDIELSLEYEKSLPPLSVITRMKKVKSHLAPNFSAKSLNKGNERVVDNLDSIKSIVMAGARYFTEIDIFVAPTFTSINKDQASSSFALTVSGKDLQNNSFKELFDMKMEFVKIDGTWLCLSVSANRQTPAN